MNRKSKKNRRFDNRYRSYKDYKDCPRRAKKFLYGKVVNKNKLRKYKDTGKYICLGCGFHELFWNINADCFECRRCKRIYNYTLLFDRIL